MAKPTDNLSDSEAWPFWDGAEEIRMRVSRYDKAGNPACFQVWIDHRNRHVPRCVGIMGNPVTALEVALNRFNTAVGLLAEGKDPKDYSLDTGERRMDAPAAPAEDEEDDFEIDLDDLGLDDLGD